MNDILQLARPEIRALTAPSMQLNGAVAPIRLHANENPWGDESDAAPIALNRYLDGQPRALLQALGALYDLDLEQILVTRGSDEAIDLLIRGFCRAGQDRILVCPPTFAMYGFSAAIQGAGIVAVPLGPDFALDANAVIASWTPDVKLVFLCSPNNPTGNALDPTAVERILGALAGRVVVVLDEAYVEFSQEPGFLRVLSRYPGLVILRTLSKAHGLAGARCGVALAAPPLISLLAHMMPPYALPGPTVFAALAALRPDRIARTRVRIRQLLDERERMRSVLVSLPNVARTWRSEANFLLVEFRDASRALAAASQDGLLLRDFSRQPRLEGCLRITIGSREENDRLISALATS